MPEQSFDEQPNTENVALKDGVDGAVAVQLSRGSKDDKSIRRMRAVATVVLIVLIILILLACVAMYALLKPGGLGTGANTGGIQWIRSIYGHGSAYEDLINPVSVTFAPDGNSLWVADGSRFRLVEYRLNGSLKQIVYADVNSNHIVYPSHIAVAPDGWIYVAESTYNRVQIFDSNWNHQRTIEIDNPTSLAASNTMLLIGSRFGFAAFTHEGDFIGQMGTTEDEIDRFDFVGGIALDKQDNAYVLDTYRNRYIKYDSLGDVIYEAKLGFPGNQGITGGAREDQADLATKYPAMMQVPQGITLDSAGRVLIIDLFDFSVGIFDAETGDFIKKVGVYGAADGQFSYPNGIAYNPQHDVFASAEAILGRVQIFGIEGSSTDPLSGLRRQFGDLLSACCFPLLIILLIIAIYYLTKFLAKRRKEEALVTPIEEMTEIAEGVKLKVDEFRQE